MRRHSPRLAALVTASVLLVACGDNATTDTAADDTADATTTSLTTTTTLAPTTTNDDCAALTKNASADDECDGHGGEHDGGEHGHEPPTDVDLSDPLGEADHHAACTEPVAPEEQAAADKLIADVEASVARFTSIDVAEAEGYRYIAPPFGGVGAHYVNEKYLHDGKILDPAVPESLIWMGDTLEGAMFLLDKVGDVGPAPGGCLTGWHSHDNLCFTAPFEEGGQIVWISDFGGCPADTEIIVPPDMMHVWVIDHPEGPFAPLET